MNHDHTPARCLICGADMRQKPCPECSGSGRLNSETCDECNGNGWVWFCPKNPDHGIRRNIQDKQIERRKPRRQTNKIGLRICPTV